MQLAAILSIHFWHRPSRYWLKRSPPQFSLRRHHCFQTSIRWEMKHDLFESCWGLFAYGIWCWKDRGLSKRQILYTCLISCVSVIVTRGKESQNKEVSFDIIYGSSISLFAVHKGSFAHRQKRNWRSINDIYNFSFCSAQRLICALQEEKLDIHQWHLQFLFLQCTNLPVQKQPSPNDIETHMRYKMNCGWCSMKQVLLGHLQKCLPLFSASCLTYTHYDVNIAVN